eukprot:65133-Prorocentrum_lima.AAC.1
MLNRMGDSGQPCRNPRVVRVGWYRLSMADESQHGATSLSAIRKSPQSTASNAPWMSTVAACSPCPHSN